MATNWLTLLGLTDPLKEDEVLVLDVSDGTMSPSGTVKRVSLSNLFKKPPVTLSVNYTVVPGDGPLLVNAAAAERQVTLFSATNQAGQAVQIKKTETSQHDVVVTPNGGDLIEGLSELRITIKGAVTLVCDGANWHITQQTPIVAPAFKTEAMNTDASGTYYAFGFYEWGVSSVTLTQSSKTVTVGEANISHGAHVGIVASGLGTASGGVGLVEIKVTGTSLTDDGVETLGDSEVIVTDITSLTTNAYFETTKKWSGQTTITVDNAAGATQTAFSVTVNYGMSAYEDRSNRDFKVTGLSAYVQGGASDSGFDIELLHHKPTGWLYAASGFVPGNGAIAQFTVDSPTNNQLTNGAKVRWKRANLATVIAGHADEGYLARITTGANNSIRVGNISVGVEF